MADPVIIPVTIPIGIAREILGLFRAGRSNVRVEPELSPRGTPLRWYRENDGYPDLYFDLTDDTCLRYGPYNPAVIGGDSRFVVELVVDDWAVGTVEDASIEDAEIGRQLALVLSGGHRYCIRIEPEEVSA